MQVILHGPRARASELSSYGVDAALRVYMRVYINTRAVSLLRSSSALFFSSVDSVDVLLSLILEFSCTRVNNDIFIA